MSQLASGPFLKNLGFIPPYWFIFACHVISILCVVFLVPESNKNTEGKKLRLLSFDSFKAIWSVYSKPRNDGRRNLIMLLISDGIVNLGVMGISGVVSLFVLRTPLCWGPATLGVFMAFRFFMQGFGGIVGIALLRRFLSDINVIRVGMLTQCASLTFFAFSDRTWMVFLGKNSFLALYQRSLVTRNSHLGTHSRPQRHPAVLATGLIARTGPLNRRDMRKRVQTKGCAKTIYVFWKLDRDA